MGGAIEARLLIRCRYYVSAGQNSGKKHNSGPVIRVPAPEIEAAVIQAVRQELSGVTEVDNQFTANSSPEELGAFLEQHLERVLVGTDRLQITAWISEASGS